MARAEVVVACRFHNLICALRLARPTVSVGYAVKASDLMRAAGVPDAVQEIGALDADALVAQVRGARADAAAISARLRETTAPWAAQVTGLLERLGGDDLRLGPPTVSSPTVGATAPTTIPLATR
jgi:polysaccharide pyruvyl transferase WcaK-like protein